MQEPKSDTKQEKFINAVLSSWRLPWYFDEGKLYNKLLVKYRNMGLSGDELKEKVAIKLEVKRKKHALARMNATTIAKIAERIYGDDQTN